MPYSKLNIPDGVKVVQVSEYHWQIHGLILINHYPLSKNKTAYIQNTTAGIKKVTPKQALAWASKPSLIPRKKLPATTKRRSSYKSAKKKLRSKGITDCFWCGKPLLDDCTIEHIVPLSKGGLDCESNWALAHEKCNQKHGDRIEASI